jgi:hypothetical protein
VSFVDECRHEWKRLGVPDAVANEMAAELAADLSEADAEGASAEDVLGRAVFDPRAFAASWAEERGLIGREPVSPRRSFPILLVVVIAVFLAVTAVGVAILVGGGRVATTSVRVAVGPNFPGPRIRPALGSTQRGKPPNRPFRVVILPAPRPQQLVSLPPPPSTPGWILVGVGLGGIGLTLATWTVLDRRRVVL